MLLAALVLAAAVQPPPALRLLRVELDLPTPDQAVLVLHGEGRREPAPLLAAHRLRIADLEIPLAAPPDLTLSGSASRVRVVVRLAEVGEGILAVDSSTVPVRWEGLDARGGVVVALEGRIDPADGQQAVLPAETLYRHYARLADYGVAPEGMLVHVSALLSIYNPFAFEVVATGLEYRLEVGGVPVLDARRGGFRLRPRQASDVLVEQTLPILDLASALSAVLARRPATFSGILGIRTPNGERGIPILLRSGGSSPLGQVLERGREGVARQTRGAEVDERLLEQDHAPRSVFRRQLPPAPESGASCTR
ncbi:MAG TPA: LEA type 2 family protein [Thermoanaerobaculaceae bacterium]|nr:LEA type 2 family protein [Thermoanaerobaculaceae bacterium]